MDELNFRRKLYTEPNSKDPEFLAAVSDSQKNKALYQEIKNFDSKIDSALKVDVPDDLANRLLLRQAIDSHQSQRRKGRIHLALAASVAFAVGISYSLFQTQDHQLPLHQSLTAHAIEHVIHEENFFSNQSVHRVSLNNLNRDMQEFNGQFIDHAGELLAAGFCVFDGVRSLHLVYKGEKDTVAVFIIPDKHQLDFNETEIQGNLKAVAKQFQGRQIVVVGNPKEELDQWQNRIDEKVQWSI